MKLFCRIKILILGNVCPYMVSSRYSILQRGILSSDEICDVLQVHFSIYMKNYGLHCRAECCL